MGSGLAAYKNAHPGVEPVLRSNRQRNQRDHDPDFAEEHDAADPVGEYAPDETVVRVRQIQEPHTRNNAGA